MPITAEQTKDRVEGAVKAAAAGDIASATPAPASTQLGLDL